MNDTIMTPDTTLAQKVQDAIGDTLAYLKGRWADESEFENWDDYVAAIRAKMPEGATLMSFTKRPWEVKWVGYDKFVRATSIKRGYIATIRYAKPQA